MHAVGVECPDNSFWHDEDLVVWPQRFFMSCPPAKSTLQRYCRDQRTPQTDCRPSGPAGKLRLRTGPTGRSVGDTLTAEQARIAAEAGLLAISLRHGPVDPERSLHLVSLEEIERLAREHALIVVHAAPADDGGARVDAVTVSLPARLSCWVWTAPMSRKTASSDRAFDTNASFRTLHLFAASTVSSTWSDQKEPFSRYRLSPQLNSS